METSFWIKFWQNFYLTLTLWSIDSFNLLFHSLSRWFVLYSIIPFPEPMYNAMASHLLIKTSMNTKEFYSLENVSTHFHVIIHDKFITIYSKWLSCRYIYDDMHWLSVSLQRKIFIHHNRVIVVFSPENCERIEFCLCVKKKCFQPFFPTLIGFNPKAI